MFFFILPTKLFKKIKSINLLLHILFNIFLYYSLESHYFFNFTMSNNRAAIISLLKLKLKRECEIVLLLVTEPIIFKAI